MKSIIYSLTPTMFILSISSSKVIRLIFLLILTHVLTLNAFCQIENETEKCKHSYAYSKGLACAELYGDMKESLESLGIFKKCLIVIEGKEYTSRAIYDRQLDDLRRMTISTFQIEINKNQALFFTFSVADSGMQIAVFKRESGIVTEVLNIDAPNNLLVNVKSNDNSKIQKLIIPDKIEIVLQGVEMKPIACYIPQYDLKVAFSN